MGSDLEDLVTDIDPLGEKGLNNENGMNKMSRNQQDLSMKRFVEEIKRWLKEID